MSTELILSAALGATCKFIRSTKGPDFDFPSVAIGATFSSASARLDAGRFE